MSKLARRCQWCGKTFTTCGDSVNIGSWRADLCSQKCFYAKVLALDYKAGAISKEEALEGFTRIGVNPAEASDVIGINNCVTDLTKVEPLATHAVTSTATKTKKKQAPLIEE